MQRNLLEQEGERKCDKGKKSTEEKTQHKKPKRQGVFNYTCYNGYKLSNNVVASADKRSVYL